MHCGDPGQMEPTPNQTLVWCASSLQPYETELLRQLEDRQWTVIVTHSNEEALKALQEARTRGRTKLQRDNLRWCTDSCF